MEANPLTRSGLPRVPVTLAPFPKAPARRLAIGAMVRLPFLVSPIQQMILDSNLARLERSPKRDLPARLQ